MQRHKNGNAEMMSRVAHRTTGANAAFHNFHNNYAHITNPNERRRLALAEIDQADYEWYHVKAIVVARIGFFTDAFDLFGVDLVTSMLGIVFWPNSSTNSGIMPPAADTAIKVATSTGNVIGQIGFGVLADIMGRKKMYGVELILILIIFTTVAQALSAHSPACSIVGATVFWRVLIGIGISGDCPLSSIITSEFATTRWRGAMMGSVFAMQGCGQFAAAVVALVVTQAYRSSLLPAANVGQCAVTLPCIRTVDSMWRIVIGFDAVPGIVALYYRLTIPETPRYTFDVKRDGVQAGSDIRAFTTGLARGIPDLVARLRAREQDEGKLEVPRAGWREFWGWVKRWRNAKVLLGTAGSWFCVDVAFYGLGLNNTLILTQIGYGSGNNVYSFFFNQALGNLVITCAGAIPGYLFTVAFIETLGRRVIQIGGFTIFAFLSTVVGFAWHSLSTSAILAFFILAQFFFNFGPSPTTFIVPGECFPTRYRSTGHGISAAAGEIGAIIAQVLIGPLRTKGATLDDAEGNVVKSVDQVMPWINRIMQIYATFLFLGIFSSFLVPETKRKTL